MINNAKPIGDKVIIKQDDAEVMRKSGIFIPETVREKPNFGTVIAVGNGRDGQPMSVKANDRIVYAKNVGTEIIIDSEEYLIMRESDIYAILT